MRLTTLLLTYFIIISYSPSNFAHSKQKHEWNFKVYLDDKEIGFHNFSIKSNNDQQLVYSKARFDVKFLLFTAYTYDHSNVEQWQGQCLVRIDAITYDNGDRYKVMGQRTDDGFIIEADTAKTVNSTCVKTFAYWDPSFLQTPRLLNSQTGELVNVEVENIGKTTLSIGGNDIAARRYRLLGEKLQIDLWYSDEDRWLALESLTESGHLIRYQIQ